MTAYQDGPGSDAGRAGVTGGVVQLIRMQDRLRRRC